MGAAASEAYQAWEERCFSNPRRRYRYRELRPRNARPCAKVGICERQRRRGGARRGLPIHIQIRRELRAAEIARAVILRRMFTGGRGNQTQNILRTSVAYGRRPPARPPAPSGSKEGIDFAYGPKILRAPRSLIQKQEASPSRPPIRGNDLRAGGGAISWATSNLERDPICLCATELSLCATPLMAYY